MIRQRTNKPKKNVEFGISPGLSSKSVIELHSLLKLHARERFVDIFHSFSNRRTYLVFIQWSDSHRHMHSKHLILIHKLKNKKKLFSVLNYKIEKGTINSSLF